MTKLELIQEAQYLYYEKKLTFDEILIKLDLKPSEKSNIIRYCTDSNIITEKLT